VKKLNVFVMFALILAFGMIFAGCGGDGDSWEPVTNWSVLEGTWTSGSYYKTESVKWWYTQWKKNWGKTEEELYGDMKMKYGFDSETRTIKPKATTMMVRSTVKRVFSGGKINTAWTTIRTMPEYSGFNGRSDSEHSFSYTGSQNYYSFSTFNLSDIQISKDQKKMKWKQLMAAYGGEWKEIVYTKQQ